MQRYIAASLLFLGLTACGPGREAAWEKQSVAKQMPATEQEGTAPEAEGDAVSPADQAWEQRVERAQVARAIELWEVDLQKTPDDAALLQKISRGYYFLADGHLRTADEEEAMLEAFERGVSYGERAMMASSQKFADRVKAGEKVEDAVTAIPQSGQGAIYWYAANLGKFAVGKGFTTTLFYKDRIFAVMQHVLSLDETYFHAAPHRYFGAFYAKAPAFAGGDINKSREHFDKALSIDADYLGTKVLYAEYYATKAEERELFTKLLTEVGSADPSVLPGLLPEQKMEQIKAKALLNEVDDIF